MSITIALTGNPNSGKTTMFNDLTGSNQYVGNWPGVTVEKKMGYFKDEKEIQIQDLPGIYSLSPYTSEEVVSRNFLLDECPDVILNIVDASNIERNLYLTTQLLELGIPVVIALNMIDVIRKRGDTINIQELERVFGCPVFETSALLKEGSREAVAKAVELAKMQKEQKHLPSIFEGTVEHSIAHIEEIIEKLVPADKVRWYAIKLFERDADIQEKLKLDAEQLAHIEEHIANCEKDLDDDSESIIINQRYLFITKQIERLVIKKNIGEVTLSEKIDSIVTNRFYAIPIFAAVIFLVYYISVTTLGTLATDYTNDMNGWNVPEQAGGLRVLSLTALSAVSGRCSVLFRKFYWFLFFSPYWKISVIWRALPLSWIKFSVNSVCPASLLFLCSSAAAAVFPELWLPVLLKRKVTEG